MAGPARPRLVAGVALIVLGLAFYALERFGGLGQAAVFLLLGGAFLAAYLYRREHRFLVPACLLLGLGAASAVEGAGVGLANAWMLGLGLGFAAIYVIALVFERRTQGWPLIPAAVLILMGLPKGMNVLEFLFDNWPLLLVLVGVMVLLGAFERSRSGRGAGG